MVLSCIGLLLHTYVSFRDREGQFALLRAVGFSLNQIATLVWIEQAIVVLTGLALGTIILTVGVVAVLLLAILAILYYPCLLYTSDAADE